ncbi:MAG TPA: GTP-binding protein [Phycisphaerales bacterium]|nr:GTP-binding protein [Phycisphaerales bacterium]
MLDALARAASPLAIDLLLDQPRRWAGGQPETCADARVLDRLIDPPLVVAIGPANIGKSTLLNALAGRPVAIVADAPGTTRDHVGALLDLDGLVVRYLDTPGVMETTSAIDLEAHRLAERAAQGADLLLLCGDPGTPCPAEDPGTDAIRVCLRADLGEPAWAADSTVSVRHDPDSVAALASTIREHLVPRSALEDPRPWLFPGLDADRPARRR